ncbi:sensor histidine kinase [Isobaculum melis]|uniref:histidine kinase n=1 Tax=Isobaculum melis TaxID=142588 RepID=A0A1H9QR52_9LACT|nr:histidine kinase [Isobaculum melis]SER62924.1 Signal transduction histidine kinase [Isobaculum melis]
MRLNDKLIFQLILLTILSIEQAIYHFERIGFFLLAICLYFSFSLLYFVCQPIKLQQLLVFLMLSLILGFGLWHYPSFFYLFPITIGGYLTDITSFKDNPWFLIGASLLPLLIGLHSLLEMSLYLLTILATSFILRLSTQIKGLTKQLKNLQLNQIQTNELRERQLFEQQKNLVHMEAKNELSHTLHDEVGHSLTGALIQMEAAKKILATQPEQAETLISNAIQITKTGIEQIRVTLKRIKPPQESLGIQRLKGQLSDFSKEYQMQTTLYFTGDLTKVTPLMWQVFSQNLKESLTNTLKYAEASRVEVTLSVYHKIIRLEVKDNGKGAPSVKNGLGLTGMEERTAKLGGHILIVSQPHFAVTTLIAL